MLNVPQPSTVPAVAALLIAAFSTIPSDPDYGTLQINYGPKLQTSAHDIIAVAVGNPGVRHHMGFQNRGDAYDESYDVNCLMWAWTASKDISMHVNRCNVLFNAVRAQLAALRAQDILAYLGPDDDWTPSVSAEGAACAVNFSVHVSGAV